MKRLFLVGVLLVILVSGVVEGKKVKHSFTIEKNPKKELKNERKSFKIEGRRYLLNDSTTLTQEELQIIEELKKVGFTGYEKEPNSSLETFILVNPTSRTIRGYEVKIDYLDMQGRMLHSRELIKECVVPAGENRKIDVESWDIQHTYYYYLGNEPKRVATPYKVAINPVSLWIE